MTEPKPPPDPGPTDPSLPRRDPDAAAGPASVVEELRQRCGDEIDPHVSLAGEPESLSGGPESLAQRVGSRLSGRRYRLQSEIARGGMGAILKVWDENLRRHLAMKVVLTRGAERGDEPASVDKIDPKMLGRFLEEAQVTGQLDHPGIVPVHELGLDSHGGVYFTMRLVRGRDLSQIFDLVHREEEGWSRTRALGVMLKVCEAMAYAHAKGVIHRDLKPANIMVGRFGEVYVMDWGLARVLGQRDRHDLRIDSGEAARKESSVDVLTSFVPGDELRTLDGDIVGTPAYMSPEQAAGRIHELGPRCDVYSAGAMLYHLVAGVMPYGTRGEKIGALTLLLRAREGPPTPLSELAPDVAAELEAICEKAMAHDEADRYADMQELADDLRAYLEHRVVKAYEGGAVAEIRKWIRRNRGVAAATLAALVLLVVGLATSSTLYVKAEKNAKLAEERRQDAVANEERAVEEKQRADHSAEVARHNEELAEAARVKVLRLSDIKRVENMEAEAAALWPATPARAPDYVAWLDRADDLAQRLPGHRTALADLAAAAVPSGEGGAELRFASTEEQWQHDVLSELVARLEDFTSETGLIADVESRLSFARTVEERTITGPEARRAWAAAIASIRDPQTCPMYGGLAIRAQLGLLPVGRDPDSGLWEFAHVQTGEVPERDADGRLVFVEETGIVLVLLPGGSFLMGAQDDDPTGPNFDPNLQPHEGPVQEVELDPFFISKYEMTQGQWLRFRRTNPSNYTPEVDPLIDLRHPVEGVSWRDCDTVLSNLGLTLPTEAQWEYAGRGGTTTIWWTGDSRETLEGAVNLADRTAARNGAVWDALREWPELDDGYVVHAPVGTFLPNPFGLHEVLGNVWEWCLDWYAPYSQPVEPGTGLRVPDVEQYHVYRGGSFIYSASTTRSSYRDGNTPIYKASSVGVRPARLLD